MLRYVLPCLAVLLVPVASGHGARLQSRRAERRAGASGGDAVNAQADLGGGFIEFLFTGRSGPAEAPPTRYRRAPAGYGQSLSAALMRAPTTPMLAPPSAAEATPRRPQMAARFEPAMVDYSGPHAPGTIVIDTSERFLYLVMADGKAMRYGVGVGRPGFEWAGIKTITAQGRMARLAAAGGDAASAGRTCRPTWPAARTTRSARAPCISARPSTASTARTSRGRIGQAVSSGCIRMRNEDVIDLYERVKVGTPVVVL